MSTPPHCRLLAPQELTQCLQWVLPLYPLQRASWILNELTRLVQSGRTGEILAAAVLHRPAAAPDRNNLLAAAIVIPQAASAATLLVLQYVDASQPAEPSRMAGNAPNRVDGDSADERLSIIGHLLRPILGRLRKMGVTFLQAACDGPDQGELLRLGGFEQLADLSLMALPRGAFAEAARLADLAAKNPKLANRPGVAQWAASPAVGENWPELFSSIAAATFVDTRDCPLLGGYRSAEEIVQCYRRAAVSDPSLCRLLRFDGAWAGCLVLTRHGAQPGDANEAPSAALELTYMGLVPEYRRRGLSARLLAETVRLAAELDASQVVLAVDQKNRPATTVYQRLGWRQVASESVWGLRVSQ